MAVKVLATTPNQGITVLNGALSDSATTIPIDSMADLKLTGLTGSDFAYCKITKQENWRQHPINRKESFEIIKVTAVSANDLTAMRGVDGTSGTTFANGDIVEVVFSSIHYQDLVDAITDGTAELNIGTLTVALGDVKITNGQLGIGVSPAVGIHLQEAVPIIRVDNTAAGLTGIVRGMSGIELMAATMNETSKFTGAVKFMSTDPAFVTDFPKLLGVIVARATQAFSADISGGTALDFFPSPNDVGASSAPVLAMTLDQNANVLIPAGFLVLPKASTKGIKVDTASPTFGFADLLGDQFAENTGATKPSKTTYNGAVKAWQFGDGDEAFMKYHIPHDYVKGTDIHLHIHWSQTSATATGGTIDFKYFAIYAKGHNQVSGSTFTSTPITASFSSININDGGGGLNQYQQHLTEVTISAASATAALFDRDDFEPDGVIELTLEMDTNSLTNSVSVLDPFIHFVDIHYQSTGLIGTKDKVPDFYA